MKKIRNKKQLYAEKERMQRKIEHLEEKIHSNWLELKHSLTPAAIVKTALNKVTKDKIEENINGDESILKSTFTYAAALLAKKMADKAEEKFDRIFKRE